MLFTAIARMTHLVARDDLTVRLLDLLKAGHEVPIVVKTRAFVSNLVRTTRRRPPPNLSYRVRFGARSAHRMNEPRSRVSSQRINVPELRSRLDGIEGPKLHAEHLRLRVGLRRHVSADNLVLVVLRETKGEHEIASVIIIIQSHTSRRSRVFPRLDRIVRPQLFHFIQSTAFSPRPLAPRSIAPVRSLQRRRREGKPQNERPDRSHPKPPSPTSPSASRAFRSFQSFVVVFIVRRARTLKAAIVAPSRLVKADVADRVAELVETFRSLGTRSTHLPILYYILNDQIGL